ncbi:MAG: DUF4920 domain-containing protein, partial [Polaribacter sp.]
MKYFIRICFILLFVFTACKQNKSEVKNDNKEEVATIYEYFGDKISAENTISSKDLLAKLNTMKVGDTIDVKFSSSIKEVCVKKGCWMKLPLGEEAETMVRFKDYGFFMPLDSKGKQVIVNGKAFV